MFATAATRVSTRVLASATSRAATVTTRRCRRMDANRSSRRYKSAQVVETTNASERTTVSKSTSSNAVGKEQESSTGVPVVQSLLAAAAGVITVSLAAAAVETSTAAAVPTYDPNSQRFDQSTFAGRFSKMLLACDPRLLLYSEAEVRQAETMVHNYTQYNVDARTLWEARRIVDAALNENGEWIPRPFRMSGYVPYNGPICVAMVASTSTLPLLLWSWVNQSQNALVNYYNRNAASTLTNETLAKSYVVAVGSALTVAFGLATFLQRRYDPVTAKNLLRYVAFPSSVAASSLNCYIVRSPEIDVGIPLVNDRGENVLPGETSNIAAAAGVYLTTASRAILQAPVFFIPPVMLGTLFKRYLTKNPAMTVPVSTYILLVAFGVGLPGTVAIFPQMSEIPVANVEEKFQHLRDPQTNKPYEKFFYNKGL